MSDARTAASIIVPTYQEAPNLPPLVSRTFDALRASGIDAEMIIVDDNSRDGTVEIVEELAQAFPIRLIVREKDRGLSGAVLVGFSAASSDRFLVMDADLQHPPESVPDLLARLDGGDCDFVMGTRYAGSGGMDDDWPWTRRLVSRVATWMARPLVRLSDPMSGFFALRREVWARAAALDPIGYKIALELLVKGRCRRPAEVPIQFAARQAGKTKLNFGVQILYLRHLWRLYRFRFPRAALAVFVLTVAGVGAISYGIWTR